MDSLTSQDIDRMLMYPSLVKQIVEAQSTLKQLEPSNNLVKLLVVDENSEIKRTEAFNNRYGGMVAFKAYIKYLVDLQEATEGYTQK